MLSHVPLVAEAIECEWNSIQCAKETYVPLVTEAIECEWNSFQCAKETYVPTLLRVNLLTLRHDTHNTTRRFGQGIYGRDYLHGHRQIYQ